MAFSADWSDLGDAIIDEFGESVTYRRTGSPDITISAAPSDPAAEDAMPGQHTVRIVRRADITNGPTEGDKIVIATVVYDIFAVRTNDGDPLARLYLSKS